MPSLPPLKSELHPFRMVAVTASYPPSPYARYHFRSRVFGAAVGIPEDQACGSAHCLLAPYWARTLPGFQAGSELRAFQASERTAEMEITVDEQKGTCALRSDAKIVAKGVIFL